MKDYSGAATLCRCDNCGRPLGQLTPAQQARRAVTRPREDDPLLLCNGCSGPETKARALAADRYKLERRLRDARGMLVSEWRNRFNRAKYEFSKQRLVSFDGQFALQWKLRRRPNEPVGPDNQQTSIGYVEVVSA